MALLVIKTTRRYPFNHGSIAGPWGYPCLQRGWRQMYFVLRVKSRVDVQDHRAGEAIRRLAAYFVRISFEDLELLISG